MKLPQTFKTRADANKAALELRKTYVGVLVHRQGTGYGVSYNPQQPRAGLPPKKKVKR